MNINKNIINKAGLAVLGGVLALASSLVNDKVKAQQLDETVAKKVAEALAAKETEA